jgi:hypothetical protein
MALTVTSAASAVALNDRYIKFTAFTNPSQGAISSPTYALIDGEMVLVTDTTLSPTLGVARGMEPGTKASAHNALAPIVYGLASDFTQPVSKDGTAGIGQYSYSVNNSSLTLPASDCVIYITKAGIWAATINGPNNDQVNKITFVSLTANAHTITYTAGFYGNTTSSDVATFPSTIGAEFTIRAKNGLWNAEANVSSAGVTLG